MSDEELFIIYTEVLRATASQEKKQKPSPTPPAKRCAALCPLVDPLAAPLNSGANPDPIGSISSPDVDTSPDNRREVVDGEGGTYYHGLPNIIIKKHELSDAILISPWERRTESGITDS